MNEVAALQSSLKTWPLGLPVLQAIREDPLGLADRLHATHGDLAHLKVLTTRICYVFNPELARSVLVEHHADFAKDQRALDLFQTIHGANVITTEGAEWERQRRILTPMFAPKRIAAYAGLMASSAEEGILVELPRRCGESAIVDVDRLMTRITMDVILRVLFSYRGTREQADAVGVSMRALSQQLMREFFWPLRPPAWAPYPGRAAKARHLAVIRDMLDAQIDARRKELVGNAEVPSDILGMMLVPADGEAASADGHLTDTEIRDNCVGLFGAGHDTSASALTWWLALMAEHRDIAVEVREELQGQSDPTEARLLNATIKEAMRLYPPSTSLFSRRALRDVQLGELAIAKGSLVVIPIWSLHHDHRWFPEPETFQPQRFMSGAPAIPRGAFMPFGAGPHFCIGQQFAMVEMAVIAAQLINRYDVAFETGTTLPCPEVDLVLKPKERLRLRFTARANTARE